MARLRNSGAMISTHTQWANCLRLTGLGLSSIRRDATGIVLSPGLNDLGTILDGNSLLD